MVAIATLFAIALPNATDFVWLFYKVYLAMAMGYFVDLTMAWFGGESEMLQKVGDGTLNPIRQITYNIDHMQAQLRFLIASPIKKLCSLSIDLQKN